MALSRIIRQANGSTDTFAVDFALGYMQESDVVAYVRGEVDGGGNQIYRTITFLDGGLMRVAGGNPSAGTEVVFDRTVEKDNLRVNFQDGDLLNEENLNAAFLQVWNATHEALDGRIEITDNLSFNDYRLTNLADPVDDGDAVSKGWVTSALNDAVEDAQMWAAAAQASAVAASNAQTAAEDAQAGAESAESSAENIVNEWNEYALGVHSEPPTETPLGNTIPDGASYYNNGPDLGQRGAYIRVSGAWVAVQTAGALYTRQNVFPTAGQTILPIGYDPQSIAWITVNGVQFKIGTDPTSDVDATSGTELVFAEPFVGDEWVQICNYTFHDTLTPDLAGVAADVGFTPSAGITSTNVQDAIVEVKSSILSSVPNSRQITGGGLATGGGNLSADRVITVPKASEAESVTGTNDTKAVTPLGLAAAIAAIPAPSSGGLVKIGTYTVSGGTIVVPLGTTYSAFRLLCRRIRPTNASRIVMRGSTDGGSTWLQGSTDYRYAGEWNVESNANVSPANSFGSDTGASSAMFSIDQSIDDVPGKLILDLDNGAEAEQRSWHWTFGFQRSSDSLFVHMTGAGRFVPNTTRWTHLQFRALSGNVSSPATITLYGYED